jgi:hypothetical protein
MHTDAQGKFEENPNNIFLQQLMRIGTFPASHA